MGTRAAKASWPMAGHHAAARHVMAAVPEQVYAAGFQRNAVVADAGRFTGKAVSFMPVARFQTN